LIASPIVATCDVIRREVTPTDGKIPIRATLTDGGLLELFEYVMEDQGQLNLESTASTGKTLKESWHNVGTMSIITPICQMLPITYKLMAQSNPYLTYQER
jgi:hypothetical protein